MADQDNFQDLPPFPEDIPTAPLLRLSLEKLLAHDEVEIRRFCDACEDIGFFYLDLRGTETGHSMLTDCDQLFRVGEALFDLTLEEKKTYDFSKQNSYFGYKAQGAAVVDRKGNLDRNEFYNVRGISSFPQVALLAPQKTIEDDGLTIVSGF
jgi:isopenicillin N synthase-like dioxygenase